MTPQEILEISHCKDLSQVKRVATKMNVDNAEAIRVWKEIDKQWKASEPLPPKEKPGVPL